MSEKSLKLNNGTSIPFVGLGTFKSTNPDDLTNAVKAALDSDYKHFDCAWLYSNEDVIGRAINNELSLSNGKLKRDDLYIVSKVWNTHHSKKAVRELFNETIKNLNVGYLDLYLIHWPMGFAENKNMGPFPKDEAGTMLYSDINYLETYEALEELVEGGKVKSIGVSNFNIEQIENVLKNCKIKPAVNQVELHPYFPNDELVEFCQKNGIAVVAYAPLGSADRSWAKPEEPILLENQTILRLAQKYHKSPAQIALKWAVQRNIVVIPKSVTPSRIKDNIEIFDFTIDEADMNEIKKINQNFRMFAVKHLNNHPLYPFKDCM